ncbi:MAG TPA: DUF4350 domain-containing protein [Kofleriaceae bacterium]|nr:DUF4350 domain-containing protein [Kofleriaceae bacterium]
MRSLVAVALALVATLAGTARAQVDDIPDYDPRSPAWNGMAVFVGLAEGMGYEVTAVSTLEWGELSANDILFMVYPLEHVEPSRVDAFVQAGGNVVIADDFGEGKEAMSRLGLLRAEVTTPKASKYQDGRVWAPIASVQADHPITRGVDEVVTNHPAALREVEGATTLVGFEDGAVVVAGERGTGRFVAVSDPSIFINRMLQYPGNVTLAANMLSWLDRHETGNRARRVVLLRGKVPMYGEPRPFINDPRGGKLGRSIADLNTWLSQRREWLLTPTAMKALAATLAALLLLLAVLALPVRRGPRIDGAWLRFGRPARRDEPFALVAASERNAGSALVLGCILRDQVQMLLADALGKPEPLYTLSEAQLVKQVSDARGRGAGDALARVYKRLRALPSRGQAAAPWSSGHLARRDFDALYRDVAELCRTLGAPLTEAAPEAA